ncbi:hypothetical protein D3C87_1486040 [compost metagenome]
MPTLKTKARLVCARHSRLLSGIQLGTVVLALVLGSGWATFQLTRLMYAEQMLAMASQKASEIEGIRTLYGERLADKDAVIAKKDEQISGLIDRVEKITHKTGQAAETANSAASKASAAAEKATEAVKQTAPRALPPQKAPDWLGGP